jgi:hypothetical protein
MVVMVVIGRVMEKRAMVKKVIVRVIGKGDKAE